jgi:hypothetical protein
LQAYPETGRRAHLDRVSPFFATIVASPVGSLRRLDEGDDRSARQVTPFPALWGPRSFNIGAGMARLGNAAGFVKAAMPLGQGNTLSDKAVDLRHLDQSSLLRRLCLPGPRIDRAKATGHGRAAYSWLAEL